MIVEHLPILFVCIFPMADSKNRTGKFILVGKITKPHGLRGEVKIFPFAGDPVSFVAHYSLLHLAGDEREIRNFVSCRMENARVQGTKVLTKLDLCSNRDEAEQFSGFFVFIRDCDLPELTDDEFYLYELLDKPLIDIKGNLIGIVDRIIEAGTQELLVVQYQGREVLIPAVHDIIVAVEKERIIVDLPPGLLNIN